MRKTCLKLTTSLLFILFSFNTLSAFSLKSEPNFEKPPILSVNFFNFLIPGYLNCFKPLLALDSVAGEDTFTPHTKSPRLSIGADGLISFAENLLGVRYRWAQQNPKIGFDCSGFVMYVFKHFNIDVPRSSKLFAGIGKVIPLAEAKKGDVILFTSPKTQKTRTIGHVGLVYENDEDGVRFIHASSGKEKKVVISPLSESYKKRFVKVVRVLESNNASDLTKNNTTSQNKACFFIAAHRC